MAPQLEVDEVIATKPKGYSGVRSWVRLEDFVADLVLKCKVGTIDDSPNFETLLIMMKQKSRPISCAISLTLTRRGDRLRVHQPFNVHPRLG